jgi:hypothetical protein
MSLEESQTVSCSILLEHYIDTFAAVYSLKVSLKNKHYAANRWISLLMLYFLGGAIFRTTMQWLFEQGKPRNSNG